MGGVWILFRHRDMVAVSLLVAALGLAWLGRRRRWMLWGMAVLLILLGLAASAVGGRAWMQRRSLERLSQAAQAYPAPRAGLPYAGVFFQKGVNFTAEWPGGYGSLEAMRMLRQLPSYGIDAVAFVPYAFTPAHQATVRRGGGLESEQGIEALARVAHGLGMKVMLKPQIWTSHGYPGDLRFSSPRLRQQWFAQYRLYLLHEAGLAVKIHADLLCVGVELTHLSTDQAEWRQLIAAVRQIYPGPLTYAANPGQEFEHVQFWDALDYIGLDEYYPLPDTLATGDLVRRVEAVQHRFQKPVLLTEVGIPSEQKANRHPWDDSPAPVDLKLQARAYQAIFQAFYRQPWCEGMYWWKIGTNGFGGLQDGSHTPWGKPAMQVMAQWYRGGGR